jgi:hypothetical protein
MSKTKSKLKSKLKRDILRLSYRKWTIAAFGASVIATVVSVLIMLYSPGGIGVDKGPPYRSLLSYINSDNWKRLMVVGVGIFVFVSIYRIIRTIQHTGNSFYKILFLITVIGIESFFMMNILLPDIYTTFVNDVLSGFSFYKNPNLIKQCSYLEINSSKKCKEVFAQFENSLEKCQSVCTETENCKLLYYNPFSNTNETCIGMEDCNDGTEELDTVNSKIYKKGTCVG